MIKFHVETDMEDVLYHLNLMELKSQDFHMVFEKAKVMLGADFAANFNSAGGMVGGWAPRKHETGKPLMVRSSALFDDLSSLSGGENHIGLTSAEFGTDIEYAHFHQTGTFNMPSRKIVFEPTGFAREVGDMAAKHIVSMDAYFS